MFMFLVSTKILMIFSLKTFIPIVYGFVIGATYLALFFFTNMFDVALFKKFRIFRESRYTFTFTFGFIISFLSYLAAFAMPQHTMMFVYMILGGVAVMGIAFPIRISNYSKMIKYMIANPPCSEDEYHDYRIRLMTVNIFFVILSIGIFVFY